MEGKKFSTPLADVEFKNGIFHALHPAIEVTPEMALEHVRIMKQELAEYAPFLMLADISDSDKSVSKEVRDCLNDKELERMGKASALVARSLLTRMAGTLYVKFAGITTPTAFFSNEADALKWLEKYK